MHINTHTQTQADGLCSAGQQTALFMQAKNTSFLKGSLLDGLQLCLQPFRLENSR